MNIRRAGLAVLAASALTVSPPATAEAASTPAAPGAQAAPDAQAGPDTSAAPGASPRGPAAPGGPEAAPGWPLPVPDVSGLLPGLFAVNVASRECLAAPAATGPAHQRRCLLDDAYRWKLVPVSLDGRFRVQNAGSDRCLVPAGEYALATGPCGDALAGTWRLRDAPGAGIYVINASSGRCLTAAPGGSAVQYRCDGDVSRRWSFRLEPNGRGVVRVNGGKP